MTDETTVTNVVIAGLGGQGVIRAANILSETAFLSGLDVKQGEIHGMSQRGGSVNSDVRFGKKVYSPMSPPGEADFVMVLHPSEVENNRHHGKKDSVFFSVAQLLKGKAELSALEEDDTPVTERNCNVAMLGMLSTYLPFADSVWEQAIRNNLPKAVHGENIAVFHYGKTIPLATG